MEEKNVVISEDIKDLVAKSQRTIIDFFQEKLGRGFTDEKLKKIEEVFNTFSVISEDAEKIHFYAGRCSTKEKLIEINRDINVYYAEQNNGMIREYKLMLEMIHEYGHAFSNKGNDVNYRDWDAIRNFEEGMQCLFSEIVMDYFFKKNNIKAKARSIGYGEKENSLPRSLLYGLKDNDMYVAAMLEYLTGDKKKFLEMLLPQEVVERQRVYENSISLDFSLRELFEHNPKAFKKIDEDSVLCHKNSFIYVLWLQTQVKEDILEIEEFQHCKSKDEILEKYRQWKEGVGKNADSKESEKTDDLSVKPKLKRRMNSLEMTAHMVVNRIIDKLGKKKKKDEPKKFSDLLKETNNQSERQ